MLLSVPLESSLGNIYVPEKTEEISFIKVSANSKVPLRDKNHVASQSICLACVAAVWGSLGQPVLALVVLLNKEGT